MGNKDITTFRGVLDFLQWQGGPLAAQGGIDPILEVTGVARALDSGPAYYRREELPKVRKYISQNGSAKRRFHRRNQHRVITPEYWLRKECNDYGSTIFSRG